MMEQEGVYMLVVQGNETREAQILLPSPNRVGNGLRCSPSDRQKGRSQSRSCPFGLRGCERGKLACPVCPWGAEAGGRNPSLLPPRAGATRAQPHPGSRSLARPEASSMCC